MKDELMMHFKVSNLSDYTLESANNMIYEVLKYCKKGQCCELEIYVSKCGECETKSELKMTEPPF